MSDIGTLVDDLIKAGCAPDVAAKVIAEAFVAGARSTTFRGNPVDETAEKRRAYDRERKRKSTEIHRNSEETAEPPVSPIDTKIKNSKKQNSDRPSRGTRIASDWAPSEADRLIAKQEGLSDSEINREALRFRDFWTGKAGAGGVKLDWSATWRNWVRTTAERLGRTPSGPLGVDAGSGFYAKFGSEEQDAWDRYGQETRKKAFPRDKAGGWNFPTRWPPGHKPQATVDAPAVPALRTMQ